MPMLYEWLSEPHVRAWWDEPQVEIELIRNGRKSGDIDGYVVEHGNQPIAYIQSWVPASYTHEEEWLKALPEGTMAIDILIARRDLTGKGIGPSILRRFCNKLRDEGARHIVIDPDPDNTRAVRAYEKAGFVPVREYKESEGRVLLMELKTKTPGIQS